MTYRTDPYRTHLPQVTGVYVRAQDPDGQWISAPVEHLDDTSLTAWLTATPGAGNILTGILLGHDPTTFRALLNQAREGQ